MAKKKKQSPAQREAARQAELNTLIAAQTKDRGYSVQAAKTPKKALQEQEVSGLRKRIQHQLRQAPTKLAPVEHSFFLQMDADLKKSNQITPRQYDYLLSILARFA